jgi:lipoprotein-anchoring transpeptidase ErfK/SrfK
LRPEAIPQATFFRSLRLLRRRVLALVVCVALALLAAGCSGTAPARGGHTGAGTGADAAAGGVRLSITPAGGTDGAPGRGITVRASGGRISKVLVVTRGDSVTGALSAAGTTWHSTWALNVSERYTVIATAADRSGRPVTRTSSFRTLTPKQTFSAMIVEGYHQTYGVGMPIILYLSRPVTDRAAVERALVIKSSRPVVGAWYWDGPCRIAPECLYFRPRHYWQPHTRVSFVAHLNGVQTAPGVWGDHTLSQQFVIGSQLVVVASTAGHYMNVYRDGRMFAHWPISTGRAGDETPDGTYLTIEKANPVDMVGPGYNIEVPWSVRITWSGDYLHDAYWSVGEQGFENVSHGCVNMSPTDAEIYYKMAVPGDPVTITGSPRAGTWDNGWTMWFRPWKQWLQGSALHETVKAGPAGSTFVNPSSLVATVTAPPPRAASWHHLPAR